MIIYITKKYQHAFIECWYRIKQIMMIYIIADRSSVTIGSSALESA